MEKIRTILIIISISEANIEDYLLLPSNYKLLTDYEIISSSQLSLIVSEVRIKILKAKEINRKFICNNAYKNI